jgi:hypothetical protein
MHVIDPLSFLALSSAFRRCSICSFLSLLLENTHLSSIYSFYSCIESILAFERRFLNLTFCRPISQNPTSGIISIQLMSMEILVSNPFLLACCMPSLFSVSVCLCDSVTSLLIPLSRIPLSTNTRATHASSPL